MFGFCCCGPPDDPVEYWPGSLQFAISGDGYEGDIALLLPEYLAIMYSTKN